MEALTGAEPAERTSAIKRRAAALGFALCGVARAEALPEEPLRRWLSNGWDAGLAYMRERQAERLDPRLLVPGARSVIVVAASYLSEPGPPSREVARREGERTLLPVARYARGRDYHNVLLKPLRKLAAALRADLGAQVYAEVDTGAVAEKAWAQRAGLGWIGKNGLLINDKLGSWLLLGALVTDLELLPDPPAPDRCGACEACLPACPTAAIPEPRYVDSRRCLAFHTIEHREPIPKELAERAEGRVFGCDACQEVCPWNRRAPETALVALRARPAQARLELAETLALTDEQARAQLVGTPLARAGRVGLVRSALAVAPRPLRGAALEAARRLLDDPAAAIRAEAQRACSESGEATWTAEGPPRR